MNRERLRMARPGSRIVIPPRATRVVVRRIRSRAPHGLGATDLNRIVQGSQRRNDARGMAEHA
ncbi:hypothetical protein [Burkholderia catarinensis]|uniref:hypothetical protein n=1 Tax=Burkholderia catarinensis TaxID=1108140 RepID=UPI000921458B|nr:hypothetical protein [Burkholderia catarinensis]